MTSATTTSSTAGTKAVAPMKLVAKNDTMKNFTRSIRIGIEPRPFRRDDADGERDARDHAGHDQGKGDDNNAAEHGSIRH